LKRHRVKKAAFHHFAAAHSHAKDSDTGVLIFVALVERQVEVLADAAIHAKAGDAVWNDAAHAVQDGMRQSDPTAGIERAIAICGAALKANFPSAQRGAGIDRPMEV
jgi:putative membrane protein